MNNILEYMYRVLILIFFVFSITVSAFSQDITVSLSNDTNNVLIGEHVKLTISFKGNNVRNVSFPVFDDTLGKIELISIYPVDTISKNNKSFELKKNIIVTCFDAGSFEVGPLILSYNSIGSDEIKVAATNLIRLNFSTIEIDSASTNIKDIKPPVEVKLTLSDVIPYLLALFIILVIYYIVVAIFGRKKHKTVIILPKYDPKIPADLEAIEALQRLENENLWQNKKYKLYYSKMTDILRVYIHRRYHLNALEMTSNELIEDLKKYEANNTAIEYIISILNISDLAKFAKYEPNSEENVSSIKNSYSFINLTKVLNIEGDDGSNYNEGENK